MGEPMITAVFARHGKRETLTYHGFRSEMELAGLPMVPDCWMRRPSKSERRSIRVRVATMRRLLRAIDGPIPS
jgi:hypothetical protein